MHELPVAGDDGNVLEVLDIDRGRVLFSVAPAATAQAFSLYGGVSRSLALDNYGKALASAVLRFEVEVPQALAPLLRGPA